MAVKIKPFLPDNSSIDDKFCSKSTFYYSTWTGVQGWTNVYSLIWKVKKFTSTCSTSPPQEAFNLYRCSHQSQYMLPSIIAWKVWNWHPLELVLFWVCQISSRSHSVVSFTIFALVYLMYDTTRFIIIYKLSIS